MFREHPRRTTPGSLACCVPELPVFQAEMRLSRTSRPFHTFNLQLCQCLAFLNFVACFSCSQRLEIRAQVADAFLSKFQLTSEEMSLLRGTREGPVTEVPCFRCDRLKRSSYTRYRHIFFKALFFHLNSEIKMHILNSYFIKTTHVYFFRRVKAYKEKLHDTSISSPLSTISNLVNCLSYKLVRIYS